MALRGGEDAGRLAIGFADMAIGGSGDQPARRIGRLHAPKQGLEGAGREGEAFAKASERAPIARLFGGDIEDDFADQGFGFLVPMGVAGFAGRIVDEGVGERGGVFGGIEAIGIEIGEGIERRRWLSRDAKGIETKDLAEAMAGAAGDFRIFALGIDADDRAIGGQQVRNDRPDTLAGAGRRHGEKMGGAVIAQELAGLGITAEREGRRSPLRERGDFLVRREARGAVGFGAAA